MSGDTLTRDRPRTEPDWGDIDTAALLEETLAYARNRDYCGPDYADGLSSRLLRSFPFDSGWLNLAVQETIKRAPVDLRPLFLVEQRRNFMGGALFAMTNASVAALSETGAIETTVDAGVYDAEARSLVDWLLDVRIDGYSGFCGGHRHDIQTLDGVVPVGTPGVVGTSYAVKALLRADQRYGQDRVTGRTDPPSGNEQPGAQTNDDGQTGSTARYATIARSSADFLFEDLGYVTGEGGACIDYKPGEPDNYYTINAVALGARFLIDLWDRHGSDRLREGATQLLRYVAACQTDVGGWYYRDPPGASHLSMDTHHNGFIIETFQRYRAVTGDDRFDGTLQRALTFYRETLFEDDGTPNFDEDTPYPRDIHAATQGILVFAYAGDDEFAGRIIRWVVDELYAGNGRFYFRKYRYHTKRVVLMRWCVAWMAYALSEFERARRLDSEDPERVG